MTDDIALLPEVAVLTREDLKAYALKRAERIARETPGVPQDAAWDDPEEWITDAAQRAAPAPAARPMPHVPWAQAALRGRLSATHSAVPGLSRPRRDRGHPVSLCPNCGLGTRARCCSWCGQVHKPRRLQSEHCSADCDRDAARADKISDVMEQDALEQAAQAAKEDPS